jgi:hypothetical protein
MRLDPEDLRRIARIRTISSLVVFPSPTSAQFGVILCCVGVFPLMFWAYLTLGHALGQTVRANPASLG